MSTPAAWPWKAAQCSADFVGPLGACSDVGVGVLKCVAVCCSALRVLRVLRVLHVAALSSWDLFIYVCQCAAVCCSVLQRVAVRCMCCSADFVGLFDACSYVCVAVCYSMLQCVTVCCIYDFVGPVGTRTCVT